jgi:hypothetical protein
VLIGTDLQRRQLRGKHRALAVIEVPPIDVGGQDELHRIVSPEEHEQGIDSGGKQALYLLRPSRMGRSLDATSLRPGHTGHHDDLSPHRFGLAQSSLIQISCG